MKLTELDEGIDGLIKALTQVPTALTPLEAGDELESTMSKIDHHFAQGLLGHDHGTTEEYGPGQGLSNPPASFPRLARVIRSYGRRGRTTNSPNIPPPDAEPVLNACESTFNIEGYPHILSAVIRLSDTRTLHNLRLTNKAVKDKVERELCRHLVVEVEAYGDEAKLSSMQHGSLPMLYNIPALRPVPGNYQGIDYAAPAICANIYQNIFNMAVTADVWTTVRTLLLVRRISLLVEPDYYTPIEHAKAKAVRMYFWEQQPLRNSPLASPLSPEKLMMFMSLRRPRGDAQDAFIWLMDGIPIPPGTTQIYFEVCAATPSPPLPPPPCPHADYGRFISQAARTALNIRIGITTVLSRCARSSTRRQFAKWKSGSSPTASSARIGPSSSCQPQAGRTPTQSNKSCFPAGMRGLPP